MNYIDKSGFDEFLGVVDEFDFFYQYNKFDFKKFNVRWLLNIPEPGLEKMSEYSIISDNVKRCIADVIKNKKYSKFDEEKLTKILLEYFC